MGSQLRIALYGHDTVGIGHFRRNLLLAQTFSEITPRPVTLVLCGTREATAFSLPPGVDCLAVPSLCKEQKGGYAPRLLDVSLQELIDLRTETIWAALHAFKPDIFIVDKVPRGACRELDWTLQSLRSAGVTRCVLGLRDVLDDPETVRREWLSQETEEAIRDYYDAVWVYGDPAVYDLCREYQLSAETVGKVRFTGYLSPPVMPEREAVSGDPYAVLGLPAGRLVLCMVGGGHDGIQLAEAFVEAELPSETNAVLVTGPQMPVEARQRLHRRVLNRPRFRVLEFVTRPELLLARADRVIAMGGYNTTCELLSLEKTALIVPRVTPRREQLIRAERLRDRGVLDMLHPAQVTPSVLSDWLARDVPRPTGARDTIDMNGVHHLPGLLEELLGSEASCHPAVLA